MGRFRNKWDKKHLYIFGSYLASFCVKTLVKMVYCTPKKPYLVLKIWLQMEAKAQLFKSKTLQIIENLEYLGVSYFEVCASILA